VEEGITNIYAFNTHYEIHNYTLGTLPRLENDLTYRERNSYIVEPRYFYDKDRKIFYIPRGYNSLNLIEWFNKQITYVPFKGKIFPIHFNMIAEPRNEDQAKAIRFLVGECEYAKYRRDSQKILIMPTGTGKTFCAVSAIQKLGVRTLIIMKTSELKKQWLERISQYTDLGGPNIVDISTSKMLHDYLNNPPNDNQLIFIVTRRLLLSFCNRYGTDALCNVINKMGIGLKIFDEAHQEHETTLFIDYFTNVKFTFYLTATFQLSEDGKDRVFQTVYKDVKKLHIWPLDSDRHIIYVAVLYNSKPTLAEEGASITRTKKFNMFYYVDYQIRKGELVRCFKKVIDYFLNQKQLKGKSLILSPKKSTCDLFAKLAFEVTEERLSSCSHHSDNRVQNFKEYDIISATQGMLGTGEDIGGLRFLFDTCPRASLPNTDQYSGRLRPYFEDGEQKTTFYVEFVDIGFETIYKWYKKRRSLLSRRVLKSYTLEWY